jgi:transglutaminase-like putative cysteine protease
MLMTRFLGWWSLALVATGCGVLALPANEPKLVVKQGAKTRDVTFTYVAKVKEVPAGAQKLELWIPMPRSNAAQTVKAVRFNGATPDAQAIEAERGNQFAHFTLVGDALKPCEIIAEYDLLIAERIDDDQGSSFQDAPLPRDLLGDQLAPVTGEPVAMAAEAAQGANGSLAVGEKLYRRVLDKMRYSKDGEGWGKGSTEWACSAGYGNCTDFHALFMTMARSRGIPARFTMGFPLPDGRGEGEVKGYHCWAEFWVDDIGWVPVDASEADKALDAGKPEVADYYFGNLTENRIAFTRGRDIDLAPKQQGSKLNFSIYPYAEVDGKPFAGLDKAFRYKDH